MDAIKIIIYYTHGKYSAINSGTNEWLKKESNQLPHFRIFLKMFHSNFNQIYVILYVYFHLARFEIHKVLTTQNSVLKCDAI
jgi:hypothetical protein